MTGFGGGATSLSVAGGGGGIVNPFDDMSNFPGATRVGTSDVIYYSTAGTTYSFTDPNGGASTYRFTAVGGGGSSGGDGGGWYGVIGGGGGGAARGEIQTAQTLGINVGYGGGSPGYFGFTGTGNDSVYFANSIAGAFNNMDRVKGRGGVSYVQAAPNSSGHWLIYGTGGMPGAYGYPPTAYGDIQTASGNNTGYTVRNGGRGFWENGGFGTISSGGGVTVNNGSTEAGGTGGCAAHQDGGSYTRHPLDLYNTYPSRSTWAATGGQSTTYAGPGGGGGSDYDNYYNNAGNVSTNAAGAVGGAASGLNTLLSGSGLSSAGGNGANTGSHGTQTTRGTVGGGGGGNSRYSSSDTWQNNFVEGNGIVIVEYLG